MHRKSLLYLFISILLCVYAITGGESRPPFACDPSNGMTKNLPFCRVSLRVGDRVRDLIGRLTLHEKVGLLVNNAAPVRRLGILGYEWWSEALHGVSNVGPGTKFGGAFPGATQFPQVITTAASFNDSLWQRIGQVHIQAHFMVYILMNDESRLLTKQTLQLNISCLSAWNFL